MYILFLYIHFLHRKLRTSDNGQFVLNLCFALCGLYVTFMIAGYSTKHPFICAVSAALLHYFFLVTFMIMASEAINLYMNLVIVIGGRIGHYVLKATIISWGMLVLLYYHHLSLCLVTPLFIVLFCFAPNHKNYLSEYL